MKAVRKAEQLSVSFCRYNAAEGREFARTVEKIYKRSYVDAIANGHEFSSVDAFMDRFERYSSLPGFDLVIAHHNDEPIGQTWGWPLGENSRSWEGLTPEPDPEFVHEDGRRTFVLSEIMVVQDWTGKGIAHALHDALLSARHEQRATLLVRPENPARRAYERWGWTKIGQLQPHWKGAPVFDAMILDLVGLRWEK
jgi:GNAT superfamily N-acetyltransferase